jgi:AAA+ superfamily predicted ATPase
MSEILSIVGWIALGLLVGGGTVAFNMLRRNAATMPDQFGGTESATLIATLFQSHFAPTPLANITISERKFPFRVRADLQRAIDRLFSSGTTICHFCGVRKEFSHEGLTLSDCIVVSQHGPAVSVPPQYEEVNVGDDDAVRCLKNALWLLEKGQNKYAVLLAPVGHYMQVTGMQFQIAVINDEVGTCITQEFFKHLEESVLKAESYRGKILSLEQSEHSYFGSSTGINVHKLRTVEREQVILPRKTLDLLDRNVIQFVRQRPQLANLRQATKKGLLFYGPPGTGKTHTIHYLAKALNGHTTLLISAEQVGLLSEYMTLARLLQPSVVVMEDVDLIARERTQMNSPCEEVLLNKLLNEMDGLKEEADILFILTTNHPEALERALSSRPGRIDQAIEFPLPDDEGRQKLVRLYSLGVRLADDVVDTIVQRTEKVSAAFIKELMRRSVQFHLERNGTGRIELPDVEQALEEMLFSGGSLNLKLLGAEGKDGRSVGFAGV